VVGTMTQIFKPEPQVVGVGGIIRWAVGDQDDPNWSRSRTWNLCGSRNSDDVYLAPRREMHRVKLSLHGTWWRLALTESVAKGLPEGHNRLLHKWSPTPERWPGWRHAATVRVPHSSLQPGWPEPTAKPRPVEFVRPPHPGYELRFDLLLGAPGGAELAVSGASEIGQMALPSRGLLIVLMHEVAVDDAEEQRLAEQRRNAGQLHRIHRPGLPGYWVGVVIDRRRCSGADRHGHGEHREVTVYARVHPPGHSHQR